MVSHKAMDPRILKLYTLSRLKARQTLPCSVAHTTVV